MKNFIKKIPVVGPVTRWIYRTLINPSKPFHSSESYWEERYQSGGNSGAGSYSKFAEFKAEVINKFVAEKKVASVIEFGSGDGNQLGLMQYPTYIGFDVSEKAIAICREKFAGDQTKSFREVKDYDGEMADLTLSLDVIYHLVEDSVFVDYMRTLFDSSRKYVIIYASNTDNLEPTAVHVRHRQFSRWVDDNRKEWKLLQHIPNKFPYSGDSEKGSFADFYVYGKSELRS